MPAAHRNGDRRKCAARTIVTGQQTVFVNGRLWAVNGDRDSHSLGGDLDPVTGGSVFCESILVIVISDRARKEDLDPDSGLHPLPLPDPAEGSPDVFAYEDGGE